MRQTYKRLSHLLLLQSLVQVYSQNHGLPIFQIKLHTSGGQSLTEALPE